MMISRERVKRALDFRDVDKIPVENFHRYINEIYPSDVLSPRYTYGNGKSSGIRGKKGSSTDAWGCVWVAGEDGVNGEVKLSPLSEWSALDSFHPPWDVLQEADLSTVNKSCAESEKFMISLWESAPNPFERMQHLRGTQNLLLDLAYGDIEVYKLRDMLHEYYVKQLEMWVNTDVDGIHLVDDWGTQKSLLISPQLWREFYKPLYKDYCDMAHSKGKYVIMHSDGHIEQIIPDLIEIGVNAINAQLDCMDIEKLAESFHGKIAFWGGIGRQYLLPFGTEQEVRDEVNKIVNAFFKYGRTGIIGQCFQDKGGKDKNIWAVYDQLSKL